MKTFKKLLLIFPMFLCSCKSYEPFGILPKEYVKEICESYSVRICGSKKEAKNVTIEFDFGAYYDNTVFVDMVSYKEEGVEVSCVVEDFYFNQTKICYLPNPSYDLNVWVKDDKSYSIQDAFNSGKIDDDVIDSLIKIAKEYNLY